MSGEIIPVPKGMFDAADVALSVELEALHQWLKGETKIQPGAAGCPLLIMLRAALKWQRDHGPRPTVAQCQHLADFQASVFEKMTNEQRARELLLENENGTILNYPKYIVEEWMRMMYKGD